MKTVHIVIAMLLLQCGGAALLAVVSESVSTLTREMGEEESELSVIDLLCLCDYLLEKMSGLEIGSK